MNIEQSVEQLKQINSILIKLAPSSMCPVIDEATRVKSLSLQYDYFMQFIGLYEDVSKCIDESEMDDISKYRYKKSLLTLWTSVGEL